MLYEFNSTLSSSFGRNGMKKYSLSGKINIGCLFIIVILIVGAYVGFKFGKIYWAKYILNRKIMEIAGDVAQDYEARTFPNERTIADAIIKEAKKLSVDITYDDIRIKREGQSVTINVTWEGDVVLPNYTHHFIFELESKRKILY